MAARKAQNKLFAALKKNTMFGPRATIEIEPEPHADSPSSLSVALSDVNPITQLSTPSSPEFFDVPGSDGSPETSYYPATKSSIVVNIEVAEATGLSVQDENSAVTPDVRVADEYGFEYASLHSRARLKLTSFSFGNNILEVLVGRRTFVIHKAVVEKRVPTLLRFVKAKTPGAYHLPHVEPDVFNIYVHHAYTGQLPSKPSSSSPTAEDHAIEIKLLCKFFAVSVLMDDEVAVRDVFHGLKAKVHEQSVGPHPLLPNKEDIKVIYDHTEQFPDVRRLMVDMHVKKEDVGACAWVKDNAAEDPQYPNEFLADLAVALLEQREEQMKISCIDKDVQITT